MHQALERVDATKPDIDRPGPKISDSGVVTVSNLPLLADPQLAIRRLDRLAGEKRAAAAAGLVATRVPATIHSYAGREGL